MVYCSCACAACLASLLQPFNPLPEPRVSAAGDQLPTCRGLPPKQVWSPEGEPTTGGNIGEVVRRNQERLKEGAPQATHASSWLQQPPTRRVCSLWVSLSCPAWAALPHRRAFPLPTCPASLCGSPLLLLPAGPTVLRGIDPRIIAALTDNPELLRALVQASVLCCAVQ